MLGRTGLNNPDFRLWHAILRTIAVFLAPRTVFMSVKPVRWPKKLVVVLSYHVGRQRAHPLVPNLNLKKAVFYNWPPLPSPGFVGNTSKDCPPPTSQRGAVMARARAYTTPGPKSRSRQRPRTSTGGPCLGARGKQAQLAQANGSKFNLLLMLVAQMSTYPRVIATHYCCWGSTKFKPTHGALTAFEDLGVVAVAVPRCSRRRPAASSRRVGS